MSQSELNPPDNQNRPPSRVIVYVDGFNLYHGLRDAGYRRYYWLDLPRLARRLISSDQQLLFTKYFTARVSGPTKHDTADRSDGLEATRKRQTLYLDALVTLPDFKLYEGQYLAKRRRCHACSYRWMQHEEKMTDVNIATQLLCDAFRNAFDTALIISADSDLVPPTLAIREFFPEKRIVVAFPPKRKSTQLKRAAHACIPIGRSTLSKSLLPESVRTSTGHTLRRPAEWA